MSIDDKINKATDEKLTSESWEYIIAACEAITDSKEPALSSAFGTIRRRLESPAGNTQLYSLTLVNALAQSGNSQVKALIASPETRLSLEKTAKTSHNTVKERMNDILESLAEAVDKQDFTEFTKKLKSKPSSSVRKPSADDDEEAQFQRALRLSMQEQQQQQQAPKTPRKELVTPSAESQASNSEIMQKLNKPMPPTPQEIRRVRALYEFTSTTPGDLSFKPGQVITIIENSHKDWWKGTLDSKVGIFPANYVEYIREKVPTTEEEYIFAQAPNVEKLLSIFANASQHPGYSIVGNQDIQAMYDEVLALRPQLIRMIDEYGARKQKLMQLNRDVVEARQRYEDLVSARMSGSAVAGSAGLNQYSQPHSPQRPRQQYEQADARFHEQNLTHQPTSTQPHQYNYPSAPSMPPTPSQRHHMAGNTPHDIGSSPASTMQSHVYPQQLPATIPSAAPISHGSPAPPRSNPEPQLSAAAVPPSGPPIQMPASPGFTSESQERTSGGSTVPNSLPYPA